MSLKKCIQIKDLLKKWKKTEIIIIKTLMEVELVTITSDDNNHNVFQITIAQLNLQQINKEESTTEE
jgi:predicted transcriptional regulator